MANPLAVIRGLDLTPSKRNKIVGAAHFGCSIREISQRYKIPFSIVRDTIQKDLIREKGKSLPGRGDKSIWTPTFERRLLRLVRANPKATYKWLIDQLGTTLSHTTLYRILKKNGITNYRARKRPALTIQHTQKRYTWAKLYLN
jgi:transposase